MNNRQQHREIQAVKSKDTFNPSAASHVETLDDLAEEINVPSGLEEALPFARMLQAEQGSIAYELLLLQQRLAAYEQLHIEEMAELRQEIERLRRAFLQETSSYLHTSPLHSRHLQEAQ
jgi:(p)ppGpp synthase/HD superfamily hydrolase